MFEYISFAFNKLGLTTKPPIIGRTCRGVPFLGFKIYPDKVYLGGKAKRAYKKNINKLTRLYKNDIISEKCFSERLRANYAYISFAESYNFRKNISVECQ